MMSDHLILIGGKRGICVEEILRIGGINTIEPSMLFNPHQAISIC